MFGLFNRRQVETTVAAVTEQRSLAEPTIVDFEIFGATASLAGVSVTPATAIRVPAVAAGVKALSEAVGILPLHAFRRTDTGRERDNGLPAFRLFNGDANPWTRGAQLREPPPDGDRQRAFQSLHLDQHHADHPGDQDG